MWNLNVTILIFICGYITVYGSYYEMQKKLRKHLLDKKRYDRHLCPVPSKDAGIQITVDVGFSDYIEIYEDTQTMNVDLWMTLSWKDYLLAWKSSDYDGLSNIRLKVDEVWHPQFDIKFSTGFTGIIDKTAHLTVSNDGIVTALKITNVNFRCSLTVLTFPFDQQYCEFLIHPNNVAREEAYIANSSSMVINLVGEGDWKVISYESSLQEREPNSVLKVSFVTERQPSYYIIFIIVPIIATTQLNPVVFLIPADSGEKISTAVTILLSYSVFLGYISDVLPKTSTSISIISIYITLSQLLSGAYVLMSILIVRMSKNPVNRSSCLMICCRKSNSVTGSKIEINASENTFAQKAEKLDKILAWVFFSVISLSTMAMIIYLTT